MCWVLFLVWLTTLECTPGVRLARAVLRANREAGPVLVDPDRMIERMRDVGKRRGVLPPPPPQRPPIK
jgi:hypothetical protein